MTAITYHQLDNTAHTDNNWNEYQKKRWAALEAFEACKFDFYVDTVGKVTTGLGFNVGDKDVRDLVMEKLLGFTTTNYGDGAAGYIAEINAALANSYTISNETAQMNKDVVAAKTTLNAQLNEIMARWDAAYSADTPHSQFKKKPPATLIIDKGDYATPRDHVIAFFNNSFAQRYEAVLNSRVPNVDYSSERIALFSLVYNGWAGGINSSLKAAIVNGDRAEAWYQIRFNTTIGEKMRHLAEAELFGLYDNQATPSEEDTVNALKMYTKYRDQILTKDLSTKSLFSTANGKLGQIGLGGTVETIDQELKPAIDYIKQYGYGEINSIDDLLATVAALDGEFLIGDYHDTSTDDVIDGRSYSLDKSDLLMGLSGDDNLSGGKGNDVLIGGDGNNTLYGNDDNDKIYGGKDDDFIIGGSGNDTIEGGLGKNDIYGGEGEDSITSKSGEDHIYGDGGDDTIVATIGGVSLEGGSGNDTYKFDGNFGSDIIVDTDGKIVVGGTLLGTFYKENPDEDIFKIGSNFTAKKEGSTLLITASGTASGSIIVQGWSQGNLGINLRETSSPELPPPPPVDPLSIDLNGNGVIDTLSINVGVHFDLDTNGFAERTGWIAPADGVLVLDRNSNNKIDGGEELFGTETKLTNGSYAKNGYVALAEFDVNKDGKIDNQDSVYSQLRIWKDSNSNGVTDSSELLTLASTNVASLDVNYTYLNTTDVNNVQHREVGTFTRTDSSKGVTNTLWFESDKQQTIPIQILNGEGIAVGIDIKALPNAKGFGNLYSLHQSMALDGSGLLQQKVQSFVNEKDISKRHELVNDILILWAGQQNTVSNSRGPYVDAKQVGVLEKFWGQPALQASPGMRYAESLKVIYDQLATSVYSQMATMQWIDAFSTVRWTTINNVLTADFSLTANYFVNIFNQQSSDSVYQLKDFFELLKGIDPYLRYSPVNANNFMAALAPAFELASSAAQANFSANFLRGDDIISGIDENDTLYGLMGNDVINGQLGSDILIGGKGNDQLYGGYGDDIYQYTLGDGNDVVKEPGFVLGNTSTEVNEVSGGGRDTLQLKNIHQEDILARVDAKNNLILTMVDGTTINVVGEFSVPFDPLREYRTP